MNPFLSTEYKACLGLLERYDKRQQELLRYSVSVSSGVSSLVLALYKLWGEADATFWGLVGLLLGVSSLGLVAVFLMMVQNRLYFVYPARQVNAIRRAMMQREDVQAEFTANQMYLTTHVTALNLKSTFLLMLLVVALLIGVLSGACIWTVQMAHGRLGIHAVALAAGTGIVVATLLVVSSGIYLARRGSQVADAAVLGDRASSAANETSGGSVVDAKGAAARRKGE